MSDDFKFDDNLVDPSLLVSDSMQTAVDMYEKRIYDLQGQATCKMWKRALLRQYG